MKKKQSLTSIELQKKVIRGILTIGALTLLIIFLFGNKILQKKLFKNYYKYIK